MAKLFSLFGGTFMIMSLVAAVPATRAAVSFAGVAVTPGGTIRADAVGNSRTGLL